ncbi:MAG: hypothetical protein JXR34_00255 [Bacteroidales bacterium]|nr:hypothetical protein [Bacteroidales bacterium]
MNWKLLTVFFALLIIASLAGCEKKDEYPPEPAIAFHSFSKIDNGTGIDDQGILSISFTDGDGDIGLKTEDTLPPYNYASPYYYNIYIDYFEKKNGVFEKIDLPISNNSRIPYIDADLPEKGIKGIIEVELYINNILSNYDTIMFSAYIYDRALNQSNVIETPEIIIDKTP